MHIYRVPWVRFVESDGRINYCPKVRTYQESNPDIVGGWRVTSEIVTNASGVPVSALVLCEVYATDYTIFQSDSQMVLIS